jgi:GR25 family glycosyltransferase involved in LPS biosynthesis
MTNIFDNCYCINLDHRLDRWEHAQREFIKHELKVERFSAINGDFLEDISKEMHKNIIACGLSHLEIIKKAKADDLPHVTIFEDDVVLHENFKNIIYEHVNNVPTWDMLYYGGNHLGELIPISNNIYKVTRTYAAHAYSVSNTLYDFLIREIPNLKIPFDAFYGQIHSRISAYLITADDSQLSWQLPNFSDINKCYESYDGLKTKTWK